MVSPKSAPRAVRRAYLYQVCVCVCAHVRTSAMGQTAPSSSASGVALHSAILHFASSTSAVFSTHLQKFEEGFPVLRGQGEGNKEGKVDGNVDALVRHQWYKQQSERHL